MSESKQFKDYYRILNIGSNATTFDIENAYQQLASKWHPDKHKDNRQIAEKKFNQINEAYEVLSEKTSRSHYDEILRKEYSLLDAHSTFDKFFGQHGAINSEEEQFFEKHYPNQPKNYYSVLGLTKNATLEDIQGAYRKLAVKYHPKNNPNDEVAHKKFVEVNQAFNALSSEVKRNTYDNVLFREIVPSRAHDIFEDFFEKRLNDFPSFSEDQFFKPMLRKKFSRRLDSFMDDQNDRDFGINRRGNFGDFGSSGTFSNGELVKTNTVYSNRNGVQSRKSVSTKKVVRDGKVNEETTEEYLYPDGTKDILKTINDGTRVSTKTYHLNKGEQLPKELMN